MNDEQRRTLALEILSDVVGEILESDVSRSYFVGFDYTLDGEPIPLYDAESPDGYGSFVCEYMPLAAVMTLISECERIYDDTEKREGFKVSNDRGRIVRQMASIATKVLLIGIRGAFCEAISEVFLDTRLIAEGTLAAILAKHIEQLHHADGRQIKIRVDVRDEIEEAAKRVTESKKIYLRDMLGRIPQMLAETRRGRRQKISLESIRRERDRLGSQASYKSIAGALKCDESTVRKYLERIHIDSLEAL